MKNRTHIHHSHISGEIIGYAHSYSNNKVRENKTKIGVVAHNLFRFNLLFLLRGLRVGVWKIRDINTGGKNPTNINFENIGNKVIFIDTIKYFQQSLVNLATSFIDYEKLAIQTKCEKFIKKDEILSKKINLCTKEDQEWVLSYLSTGKRTIPYEMIKIYDSLDISPEDGNFFLPHNFYSNLRVYVITMEEYKNVKKFFQAMKLKNLGELNKIYKFQDTIILCEIFEQRSEHLQKLFKCNPCKCNSASSFSDCVHRDKSKCLIALPTDAEHVRVFERTLIGGFSRVNTNLAFHTQILLNENKNEKVLLDPEIDGKKQTKIISTKILKMDENNQYEEAMTKPLLYGYIKKQEHPPSLLEFNKILDKISHGDKVGHLFIVDINFHDKIQKICYPMKSTHLSLKK